MKLKFKGQVISKDEGKDPETFNVTVPEFMHDEDEFLIELDTSSLSSDPKPVVSNEFKKHLLESLLKYQTDLIATHSEEIQE